MKSLSYLLLTLLPAAALAQSPELKIKGSINNIAQPVKKVAIAFRMGDERIADTVLVEKGTYKYKRPLAEPVLANVTLISDSVLFERRNQKFRVFSFQVYLEPGTVEINTRDSVQGYGVKGSAAHKDFETLTKGAQSFQDRQSALFPAYAKAQQEKDQATMERIQREAELLDSTMREEVYGRFAKTNPSSPVALYALREYAGYSLEPAKIQPIFASFSKPLQESKAGKAFGEQIAIAQLTEVGRVAMDFTQNDSLDRPVALSSFRGKYLLVDFWASWCGPCRRENPNVVKAFNTYKDKNFTILGVSLDRPGQKEAWLKAIAKDGLTWNHVSDLKYWDNAVAKQYGIRAIPANLLIDPQGKIIAKNLSGEELQQKLAEVLR